MKLKTHDGGFMLLKLRERKEAIHLRRKGKSYREILRQVPVAKSTLSLWLRSVGLSKRQEQRLTLKRLEAGKRGALAQRRKRLKITREIKKKARDEIAKIDIDNKTLWLMGVMLYWAEGAKERENGRPTGVGFGNSDPFMIKLFVKWLYEICKVPKNHIKYELYIHLSSRNRLIDVKKYWARNLNLDLNTFQTVYFKKHNVHTNRKKLAKNILV
jgi:hypothetical protein